MVDCLVIIFIIFELRNLLGNNILYLLFILYFTVTKVIIAYV